MTRARSLLIASMLLAACGQDPAASSPSGTTDPPPAAPSREGHTVLVESARHVAWLDAPARTLAAPDSIAVVGVPLPARVMRIRVQAGQQVEAREVVLEVLMPELVRAAGALTAANLRLDAYTGRLQRLQPLVDQGLARSVEAAEVEAQVALTKAEREMARATLRAAGVSDSEAAALTHNGGVIALRTPIAGTVTAQNAHVGEHRDPNSGSLVEVTRAGPWQVEARLLTEPIPGVPFEWIDGARTVPLTLDTLSPAASTPDGARLAWLHPTDATHVLPAGLVGRIRPIPSGDWVSVPAAALLREGDSSYVMKGNADAFEKVTVNVITGYGDRVLVTGIESGSRVLADAVGGTP
jgi:membrane fusion protein, heavy metal efflux system